MTSTNEIDDLFERGKAMASALTKIKKEEITEDEKGGFYFGNNFFYIFLGMKRKKRNALDFLTGIYLKKAEKLEAWNNFINENTPLIEEIDAVLEDEEALNELRKISQKIREISNPDNAEKFNQDAQLDEIQKSIARRLNPLLEKAAYIMQQLGIDTEALYQ